MERMGIKYLLTEKGLYKKKWGLLN
jgi:hypothetical protein